MRRSNLFKSRKLFIIWLDYLLKFTWKLRKHSVRLTKVCMKIFKTFLICFYSEFLHNSHLERNSTRMWIFLLPSIVSNVMNHFGEKNSIEETLNWITSDRKYESKEYRESLHHYHQRKQTEVITVLAMLQLSEISFRQFFNHAEDCAKNVGPTTGQPQIDHENWHWTRIWILNLPFSNSG